MARLLLMWSAMTSRISRRVSVLGTGLAAAFLLFSPSIAGATEIGMQRKVGIGLVAGSAPGLTAKIWTSPANALDLGFGFGLGSIACSERFNPCGKRNSFNADYLWQTGHGPADLVGFHLGLGARFWFWNYGSGNRDLQIAARLPIGLDVFAFKWLEVYGEVTPSLAFDPNFLFFEGAIGARIYL